MYRMGRYQEAIACYEQALALARGRADHYGTSVWLGNLGNCYSDLGEFRRAIDLFEQSLAIAREHGYRQGEAHNLMRLNDHGELGDLRRAVDYVGQGLAIAREIGDRPNEGIALINLGIRYVQLGEVRRAVEVSEQALDNAHELGDRLVESGALINLGDCDASRGRWGQAIRRYDEAAQIADEMGVVALQCGGRCKLAKARLFQGDLPGAREAAEAATSYDSPTNNASARVILGVVLLRQGSSEPARLALAEGVARADAQLEHTSDNFGALDVKTVALCGLALLGDAGQLPAAIAAAQAARAINSDTGVVSEALRWLDALAVVDHAGILAPVRRTSEGRDTR